MIIFIFGLFYLSEGWDNFFLKAEKIEVDPSTVTVQVILVIAAGILYYSLDLRAVIWCRYFLPQVHDNIFSTLLTGKAYTPAQEQKIRNPKNLTLLFYSFIDNDASLTNKSKDVYGNGYVASTLCDLIVISAIFVLLFTVTGVVTTAWYYYSVAALCMVVMAIASLLLFRVRRKHINLSNDQMHYIKQKYGNELNQRLDGLL